MPQLYGKAQTYQPSAVSENAAVIDRMSKYGDIFTMPVLNAAQALAMEGGLFISRPTPAAGGSGTAMSIQTSFSDTNAALILRNGDSAKTYLPVYLKLRVTAAGASTTSSEISFQVDAISRYSSGGTSMTIYRSNPSSSAPASNATVNVGTVTAAAASASRQYVGSFLIRSAAAPAHIVNDVHHFYFGMNNANGYSKAASPSDTTAAPGTIFTWPVSACAIPAGGSLTVHIANVANATTAPSFEFELAWIER